MLTTAIPISGWGEIDLQQFRMDIEPTFTVDARTFASLVDTVQSPKHFKPVTYGCQTHTP